MCGVFGFERLFERDSERFGHTLAVGRVGVVAVTHMALFDEQFGIAHGARRVLAGRLLVLGRHYAPQQSGLGEIIVVQLAFVVVEYVAVHGQGRLFEGGIVLPFAVAVGFVAFGRTVVAVGAHPPVAVERVVRTAGFVHGNLHEVHAQSVTLRVAVGEQTALQHLVGRETDALDDVHGVERRLLDIRIVVLRIAVQLQDADFVQREILVIPYFCQVERIEFVVAGLLFGHQLHVHRPAREIAAFDGVVQVALVRFAVFAYEGFGLGVGQVFDALLGPEVELHPGAPVVLVVETVRVASESVHVAVRGRNAPRRHGDRHLMQRFGQQGPEIPVVVGRAQVGARVAFHGMVQVGEFQRVAQEEYRGVVAHEVPVARIGVEFHGEAADVAFGVGCAAFAGHGREAHEAFGLLADLGEDRGARVSGDVLRDRKGAECTGTLGVHAPFGNDLAVEMSEFFEEPRILQRHGSPDACGLNVLIVGDRPAVLGCQFLFVHNAFHLTETGWFRVNIRHDSVNGNRMIDSTMI